MPGWPGGLGNRLQGGPPPQDGGLGDRLQNWWDSTTFFKPAYDDLVGGATMFGDVMSGAQPTMAADPQTGEFHTDPGLADRAMNAAGMLTLGAGAVPAEANSLRTGITTRLHHGSPRTDLQSLEPSTRGPLGPGVYTSPNEGVAGRYAGNEGKTYALPERERDIFLGHGHRTDEEWAGFKRDKERLLAAAEPEKKQELSALLDRTWSGDGYPTFARISQMYGGDARAHELFKRAGFEGLSGQVDGPEVLLFGKQGLGIRAYHGSPHDFERFDSSKIGTGEGAQAYGHGLYAAENEAVARQYRDLLSTRSSAVGDPVARAQFWASDLGSREAAITHLEGVLKQAESRPKNFDAADLEKSRQAIDYLKSGGDLMPKSGHMYEVDIAADPEHFLDWDKPLSEQSPQVRRGYAQAVAGDDPTARELLDGSPESFGMMGLFTKSSGAQAYNTLAGQREFGADAAKRLREAGVPGIRYLDQGSRGLAMYDVGSPRADFGPYTPFRNRADAEAHQAMLKRQGFDDAEIKERAEKQTSNYVVFDDKLISILKKYGLPLTAAGLAALSQLHPQEAQAAPLGDRLQGR